MRKNLRLGPIWVLLSLLLPRAAADTMKPHYMVLVPSQLNYGAPEKACVILKNLNETVTVNLTLQYGTQFWNLLSNQVAEKDSFFCHPFNLPDLHSPMAIINVQVKGRTQRFTKTKLMDIKKIESLIFVQTDKPVYKPSQKVRFRIVSVDINFHPVDEMFPVVYIENPKKNRIFQWQNIHLQGGLTQLSFPLSEEPSLGTYTVILQKVSGGKLKHSFEVMEYVLPRFEVHLKLPKKIGFLDEEFEVTACGEYTYGKPVPGLVTISVCRRYLQSQSNCRPSSPKMICYEFNQQADKNGCFTKLINTNVFQLEMRRFEMFLKVEATIKEEGTGLELTEHGKCEITDTFSKLTFIKVDSHYRPGLPFWGEVLLTDKNDQPITNETITVSVTERSYKASFITNEHGLAKISIDTTNFKSSTLSITVTYKSVTNCYDTMWLQETHPQAFHVAKLVFSPSNSYIHLEPIAGTLTCGQMQTVRIHYTLNEQILKDQKELIFYFLIKARGSISQATTSVLPIGQGNMKGVFPFSFQVELDMAPTAQLIAYAILPSGELVADVQEFKIEKCFANKVHLSFSSTQSMPAAITSLEVTGTPLSLCALRAVDQSMLLMKPESHLSAESIYKLLPSKNNLNTFLGERRHGEREKCSSVGDITKDGIIYTPKSILEGEDIYSIFQSAGLDIFTNSKVRKPHLCVIPQPPLYPPPRFGFGAAGVGPVLPPPRVTLPDPPLALPMQIPTEPTEVAQVREIVRKYFPETWIWDIVVLNASGVSEMTVKVPDSITEWKASAFCLSSTKGLGLSPSISLQVFQPFFLALSLPYSVVQGEAFTLKATVLNYLPHCIRVKVQLEDSSAFLAIPAEKNTESHCICGNERKTMSWAVTPKSLGKVNFTASAEALQSPEWCDNGAPQMPAFGQKDTVIKSLLVEPEGIEKEETFNTLLCASDTEVPEKLSLKIPSNVVKGSSRATYTVLGDVLSSAMQNLQNLVQMPYGCGEQNMILFVPNIYVLSYLNETGQLTEKIKLKAITHLISGYQRQLNYKHNDGSYSTFGSHGGTTPGNTWLTAFVLKSFSQAQSYIFVDKSHITAAFTWLSNRQKENGCFQPSGTVFNNAIKGGVDDEMTLSAYISIALLEMPLPISHPVVRNALYCLETAWKSISEAQGNFVYAKALLAYAFALAGDQAKRNEVLKSLDREAVKQEDSIHWQRPKKVQEDRVLYYQLRAPSAEVEMTAYILLAYLTVQPAPSSDDLSMALPIVKWITKQQNPYGGFSSTQDTVVALQALSKYEAQIFAKSMKAATVTVKSSGGFSKEFQVNEANRLLLQEVQLPEIPGEYVTTISQKGCVYLQTSLKYNILPEKEVKAPFNLKVDTFSKDCDRVAAHKKFRIHINISYAGERPKSNMVIVDVKMISGFIPVKSSVKKLQESTQIPRTEVSTNHVLIYFKELTDQNLSLSFLVEQDIQVENLKPAIVKAYDYYEKDEFAIEEYSAPCSSESEQGSN